MRSYPRLARRRWPTRLSLSLLPMLSACATHFDLTAIAPACAPLVEASGLLIATPPAPPPPAIAAVMTRPTLTDPGVALTIGELGVFADAQTGQLDKANRDKSGALRILETCESRNARAIAAVTPHGIGWGIFHRRAKL